MKTSPLLSFVQHALGLQIAHKRDNAQTDPYNKLGNELTENMRALRMVARLCDYLLSRGVAASDVVYAGLGITKAYCSQQVHIDVSYNVLTLSQDRGIDREPLTLVRGITQRGSDYNTVQRLEQLAGDIRDGLVPLDEAEKILDDITAHSTKRKRWLTHISAGGVSAGVVMLYSTNPYIWILAGAMGVAVNWVLYRLTKLGMPSFYAQAVAGLFVIVIATLIALLAGTGFAPFLSAVHPTYLIIGGIVMLLAGLMVVSALQDAIDEYYLTAMARLLKVMMMTSGIVLGVTVGLYFATKMGVTLAATPDRLTLSGLNYQYIGAAILAAAFAIGNNTRLIGVIAAGVIGFSSLFIMLAMTNIGFGVIPSSGIAAAFAGLSATVMLRLFNIPTIATISAGIIPLVPGLTLYSALTQLAQASPDTAAFDQGVSFLFRAILIAAAIAAGATLGNLIGRPARRRAIYRQNRLPFRRLSIRR